MPKLRSAIRFDWSLVAGTADAWAAHNAQRLGAALAYYTILSIAPLILIFVSIAGRVFGDDAVRGQIYWQIRSVAGDQAAAFIQEILKGATLHSAAGIIAGIVGFVVLLLGSSGIFMELRDDINYIWEIPAEKISVLRGAIVYRLFSFALIVGAGVLITLSLSATIAVQAIEKYALHFIPAPAWVFDTANFLITFLVTAFLFGLIYTVFPKRRVPWTDVVIGSIVTAILFAIGKWLVGLYIGRTGVGSLYGAAGSLVVMLVWVYYSSQIFLFGAEFTHVYSQRHGALREEQKKAQRL